MCPFWAGYMPRHGFDGATRHVLQEDQQGRILLGSPAMQRCSWWLQLSPRMKWPISMFQRYVFQCFHEHLMAMAQNIRLIGIPNGLVAFRNWPATISLWVIVDLPHIRDGSIANEPTLAHTCPGSDQYYAWKEEGKREFPVLMHLCFDSIVKMIKSLHPKAGYCSSKSTIWIWLVVEPPTEKYHRHAGPSSLCRLQN